MDERLIVVVGGGLVGLTFAALLQKKYPQNAVAVLEGAPKNAARDDGKSVVFNPRAVHVLQDIKSFPKNAQPINYLEICRRRGFATAINAPLGVAASHADIHKSLSEQLQAIILYSASLQKINEDKDGVIIEYSQKNERKKMRCRLAVVACEVDPPPPFVCRRYVFNQAVFALTATAKNWTTETAYEKFSNRGIVALVPRADKKYPVGAVICANNADANWLSAKSDGELSDWLDDEFGGRFGLRLSPHRFIYAPQFRNISPTAAGRIAFIGGGATTLHPVAAQGLNLGIADAEVLATILINAGGEKNAGDERNADGEKNICGESFDKTPSTIFSVTQEYARRRRFEHRQAITATNTLSLAAKFTSPPCRALAAAAMRVAVFAKQKMG